MALVSFWNVVRRFGFVIFPLTLKILTLLIFFHHSKSVSDYKKFWSRSHETGYRTVCVGYEPCGNVRYSAVYRSNVNWNLQNISQKPLFLFLYHRMSQNPLIGRNSQRSHVW